jgi:large conductance mechanosensitive channel
MLVPSVQGEALSILGPKSEQRVKAWLRWHLTASYKPRRLNRTEEPPMAIPSSLTSLKPSWLSEFRAFIMRGNVVDLAVGIIIGVAFTGVVNSLVKDVFNPILGLVVGGIDFANVFIALNGQHYATLADAQHAGAPTLNLGLFINAIINFLIVGFAIFWVVKALTRLHLREDAHAGPTMTEQLLTEIRDILQTKAAE